MTGSPHQSPLAAAAVTTPRFLVRHICTLPLLAFSASAHAQQEDEQLWFQLNTHVPLDANTRVTLEQIARFGDRHDGLTQSELGVLVGQRVSRNLELGFGYRHVGFHNLNPALDEERFRQQVVGTFGPLSTRFRVDERFHPHGKEVGFRIRPLVRYNHKLNAKGLAAFVSHESFYLPNATKWGQRRGYERMRNWVGLMVPVSRKISADVGYLNQYRFGRGSSRAQMDHALSMQLTINLAAKGQADSRSSPGD
jgi:Protein of unknown function (DUF2490)